MGYGMTLRESKFFIPKDKVESVFEALRQMALKKAPRQVRGSFAWTDTRTLQCAISLREQLKEWRWRMQSDEEGNVTGLSFEGEKLGDDLLLFSELAPFVQPGSYLLMHGEDGEMWRWYFDGAQCREQTPRITFD